MHDKWVLKVSVAGEERTRDSSLGFSLIPKPEGAPVISTHIPPSRANRREAQKNGEACVHSGSIQRLIFTFQKYRRISKCVHPVQKPQSTLMSVVVFWLKLYLGLHISHLRMWISRRAAKGQCNQRQWWHWIREDSNVRNSMNDFKKICLGKNSNYTDKHL